jgi:hypothetical protein
MALPEFDDLPFNARPDLTPYLLHLTKNSKMKDKYSGYDNLVSILKSGEIWGSKPTQGFIKGSHTATCFMDVPFASLKYILTPKNSDPQRPRYEPYGIAVTKQHGYKKGCRPVLYLSNPELAAMKIAKTELWRVVRLEVSRKGWISWLHEREWRCKGAFQLPGRIQVAFVRTTKEARNLSEELVNNTSSFKCVPSAIIPLTVVCQGLMK